MSAKETGHAKNVASYGTLVTDVESFGTTFNPSNDDIKLTALRVVKTSLESTMTEMREAERPYKTAINARQEAFKGMSPLATKMKNALLASKATKKEIKDGESLAKKLTGGKKALDSFIESTHEKAKTTSPQSDTSIASEINNDDINQHSNSQMGYDNRIENFKKFITFLTSIPSYNPNEDNLKIETLTTYANSLQPLNNAVDTTFLPFYNARSKRNNLLYATDTGVHDLVQKVKSYVKSAYGVKSPEYKLISKIQIKVPKI